MRRFILVLFLLVGCTKEAPPWPVVGALMPPLVGQTQDNAKFALTEGRPTLLFFGYTFCPDVCPLTLLTVKRALSKIEAPVDVVFVTVDPARDTTSRLKTYLAAFGDDVRGVVPSDVSKLEGTFKVAAEIERVGTSTATDMYTVNHTSIVFLIDGSGKLAARISHGASPQEMRQTIEEVIR